MDQNLSKISCCLQQKPILSPHSFSLPQYIYLWVSIYASHQCPVFWNITASLRLYFLTSFQCVILNKIRSDTHLTHLPTKAPLSSKHIHSSGWEHIARHQNIYIMNCNDWINEIDCNNSNNIQLHSLRAYA